MESIFSPQHPKALPLSEYTRLVATAISREPLLMGAWVTAEISDMSVSGGHCYMTLIEKDASGTTIARMRGTIWANRYAEIRMRFLQATGSQLSNGMKVMLYGAANYHSNYGLSFNIGGIDPSYTMGDLERLRREILEALQKEGVIDMNKRIKITDPLLKIAVVSSEKAAGYGDFMHQIRDNKAGYAFQTLLFPAVMQGDKTAQSVTAALDMIEQTQSIVKWDCVVIIRGGGATTDMNGFDNLALARRVATFPLPVIVGIGHERDRCVLDEIACIRCKTPTAVAAWLCDNADLAWQRAGDLATRITSFATERIKGEQIRLQSMETMVPALSQSQVGNARMKLQNIYAILPSLTREATSRARLRLESIVSSMRLASGSRLQDELSHISNISSTMKMSLDNVIDKERTRLDNLTTLIDVLNPVTTLRRGYSITRIAGKAVTGAADVAKGEIMETVTASGTIFSTVETVCKPQNPVTNKKQ